MSSDVERMARLWQLPLDVVVRYATVTRTFVEVPVERWATGRYVPYHCEPSWVAALSLPGHGAHPKARLNEGTGGRGRSTAERRRPSICAHAG